MYLVLDPWQVQFLLLTTVTAVADSVIITSIVIGLKLTPGVAIGKKEDETRQKCTKAALAPQSNIFSRNQINKTYLTLPTYFIFLLVTNLP